MQSETLRGGYLYLVELKLEKASRLPEKGESRVEVGLNTSTKALRVIGVTKRKVLNVVTVKFGHKSQRTRTQGRWQGPAAIVNDRPVL
jgi:hypothetical protein